MRLDHPRRNPLVGFSGNIGFGSLIPYGFFAFSLPFAWIRSLGKLILCLPYYSQREWGKRQVVSGGACELPIGML